MPLDRAVRPRRGAAVTKRAILTAAQLQFTADSFDQVGVREIAATAGVDPALVIRYFGSKERLFAEAVTGEFRPDDLIAGDRATFGERAARGLLTKSKGAAGFDPMLALIRSAGSDEAAPLIRRELDANFVRPLADWLGGSLAAERAGLITAMLAGLGLQRHVVGSASLIDAALDDLVALAGPILQAWVDDTGPTVTDSVPHADRPYHPPTDDDIP